MPRGDVTGFNRGAAEILHHEYPDGARAQQALFFRSIRRTSLLRVQSSRRQTSAERVRALFLLAVSAFAVGALEIVARLAGSARGGSTASPRPTDRAA